MKTFSLILSTLIFNLSVLAQFTSDMNFTSSEGENINPTEILNNGQYLYLDFYSTTCGACNSVASEVNNAYILYGQNNQNVFFMGVDNFSSASSCQSFSTSHNSNMPVVAGQEGGSGIFSLFNQTSYPKGILINPAGEIVSILSYATIANLSTSLQSFVSPINDCDLIETTAISYNTSTDQINLSIFTSSSYLYGYPSFIILNNNGDTLAAEQVNYYGLSGESIHYLNINNPFYYWDSELTLQLYSGFLETMECEYNLSLNEIEYVGCTDANAYNYNYTASVDNGSGLYTLDYLTISIDIDAGWNLVGFSCTEPIDAINAFAPYTDKIVIVKNHLGTAYLPEYGFNGIGNLEKGYGYQLKINEAIEGFNLCNP